MASTTARPAAAPAAPATAPTPSVDENAVADFLLKKKYYLAALELHQELLEGNNGVHNVGTLHKFFGDAAMYNNLVKSVADMTAANKRACECCMRAEHAQRAVSGRLG